MALVERRPPAALPWLVALAALAGVAALVQEGGRPTAALAQALQPYALPLHTLLISAAVLLALLTAWIVRHAAGAQPAPGPAWLAAGLQGAALLLVAQVMSLPGMPPFVTPASADKARWLGLGAHGLMAAGLLGLLWAPRPGQGPNVPGAQAGPQRPLRAARQQGLLQAAGLGLAGAWLLAVLLLPAVGGGSLIDALLHLMLATAFGLAIWRAGWPSPSGPDAVAAWIQAAAAAAVPTELLMAWAGGRPGGLALAGALGQLLALGLLYRGVLQLTLRDGLNRLGEMADALEAAASPVLVCDAQGGIRWANTALCQASGHRRETLLGSDIGLLECADEAPATYAALHQALASGSSWRGCLPVRRHDGSHYLEQRSLTPIHNALGELTGFVWVGEDVTERSRADELLRRSEESLRQLVACAPDAIVVTDEQGRIQRANPQVQALLGYSPEELEGLPLASVMPADIGLRHGGYMAGYAQGRRAMTAAGREVQARRRDGSLVDVHVRVGEMPFRGGRSFVGFLRDMTQARRERDALVERELQFREVLAASADGFWLTDLDGRLLVVNDAYVRRSGYSREQLLQMHIADLSARDDAQAVAERIAVLVASGRDTFETVHRAADGELWPAEVAVTYSPIGGQRLFIFVRDITTRRRAEAERERLQRQLMQAQKMEALGQLTGGLAHDFNNMLAGILGLSSLALERHVSDPDGKLAFYLREIVKVSERGRDLIDKLMAFARPKDQEPATLAALEPAVRDVMRMLRPAVPSRIEMQLQAEPGLPPLRFVPVDLHQVVTNLLINARDAIAGEGQVRLELRRLQVDGGDCASCGEALAGPWLQLAVHDTGCGMDAAVQARIFEPFFTTKDIGKGSGLGLAMVHSLAHKSGGHLRVSSEPGRGTTVELLLPLAEPDDQPAPAASTALPRPGPGPCTRTMAIWVVDDDSTVLAWLVDLLVGHGHTVRGFADPRAPLQALQDGGAPPDLLVTDQTMPQLSGAELARQALALHPGLPVVLCTGFSDRIDEAGAAALGITQFLRKPFEPQRLLALVDALASTPPAGR